MLHGSRDSSSLTRATAWKCPFLSASPPGNTLASSMLLKTPLFDSFYDSVVSHCMCAPRLFIHASVLGISAASRAWGLWTALPWTLLLLSHCHVRLFCDPKNCSPPGSSVQGTSQARILEWVATSFSRRSSWPRDQTHIFCISRQNWFYVLDTSHKLPSCFIGGQRCQWLTYVHNKPDSSSCLKCIPYLLPRSVCQNVKEDGAVKMRQGLSARATLLHQAAL